MEVENGADEILQQVNREEHERRVHVVHDTDLDLQPLDEGSIPPGLLFSAFQLVVHVQEEQVVQRHARDHQPARIGREDPAIEGEVPQHAARGVHEKPEQKRANQLRTHLEVVREDQIAAEMVEEHLSA